MRSDKNIWGRYGVVPDICVHVKINQIYIESYFLYQFCRNSFIKAIIPLKFYK